MYTDLAVFSDTDTVAETVAAIRLLCLPRGRARIFVPEGGRDIDRERALLGKAAGAGVHISLDALDPKGAGERAALQIAPNCQAVSVIRPEGVPLSLGVLERSLLKHTPVPVWFWNTTETEALRVVVAADPDAHDARRDSLNDNAIDQASDLAARAGGSVVVVNAWQLDGEYDMRHSPFLRIADGEIAAARRDIETARADWLGGMAARCRLRGVPVEAELREGPAEHVIPAMVDETEASVLVVGTMKRRGFAAMVRPNTAVTLANGFRGSLAVMPARDVDAQTGGGRLSRIAAGTAFA